MKVNKWKAFNGDLGFVSKGVLIIITRVRQLDSRVKKDGGL